ncbi:uncharacterized protein Z518_02535 [Rhinocladiella mackenziei CBS 650.93]|uniref:BZIP domain-containing protein n=1 Tax=Rhinocladiella mackenziei CBS 650.93 TaxID=1442369 RepID=A0A0D2IWX7_9EURO|nr:uncharacterized protein Z518_02535 [Rhinocladiella mackenziei CBS 650.93]KIX07881.1 hypothetical protein Z518_02535 [Rhinocladiella mackenziei CBS 650.93]
MEPSKPQENKVDSWYGVLDPRKRKQIQDRLAQRARRKRLSEAGKFSGQSRRGSGEKFSTLPNNAIMGGNVIADPSGMIVANANTPFPVACSSSGSSSETNASGTLVLSSAPSLNPPPPCDHRYLPDLKMTAIEALWVNGSILGIPCSDAGFDKSSPQPSTIPHTLCPTPLQLAVPHYIWIDRWPFPRMRDNMIILSSVIDAKELFYDFFTMQSFIVKKEEDPWNPEAWEISHEFNTKWGYLFY